jgi:hypothetical protein
MGFLNPAAWLLSPLFAILVALYLWEQQRRRVDVPSLMLWQTVPDAVVRTSRFRPDLLFFLQLLLLSLLILGFARPYLSARNGADAGQRHIFVLDTSASMQAREEGGSRFDQARDAVLQRISRMSAQDEAMLISAARYPRVIRPFSRDHATLARDVRSLQPVDTGTQLEPALALARRAATRGDRSARIELFTDIRPSQLGPEWTNDVTVSQVGQSDDNLAIEGLEIFQGRFQDPNEASARVTLHNFSHRDKHGFLNIRLNGEVLSRRGFSLSAGELRSFPLEAFPHSGVVRATLEVDDALAIDNEAYGWVRPLQQINLLVVSETSSLRPDLERIAQSVPNLKLLFLSPSEYRTDPSADGDVILFEGYVPAELPARASLYVFPDRSGPWFSVKGNEHSLPVLNWNEGHAALGDLLPQLVFPLSNVRIVQLPDWAEVLVSSNWRGREVPLVFAGQHAGRRLAGISFDLAAEHMLHADNVNLLLLFTDLLDWLLPPDTQVVVQRTGEIHSFQSRSDRVGRVTDPLGKAIEAHPGEPLRVELLHAGEYRVLMNGNKSRLYANFVDPAESDIGRGAKETQVAEPAARPRTTIASSRSSFDGWLYALAALMFVVEWMAALRI